MAEDYNSLSSDGSASSDNETLRQQFHVNTLATRALTAQVETLNATLETGFANLSNSLAGIGSLGSLMTHVGEIAAQLTAINSHHAQFGVAWTSTPGNIAKIATNMDKSQSASTKLSSATNPHDRPLNLATSTGVKGWRAGVELPAHIPTDIKVGPEAK